MHSCGVEAYRASQRSRRSLNLQSSAILSMQSRARWHTFSGCAVFSVVSANACNALDPARKATSCRLCLRCDSFAPDSWYHRP